MPIFNCGLDDSLRAMTLAASLSIFGDIYALYLHPPAAAVALIVVPGQVMHYRYAFFLVMVDSILLVIAGVDYSNLTGNATLIGKINPLKTIT